MWEMMLDIDPELSFTLFMMIWNKTKLVCNVTALSSEIKIHLVTFFIATQMVLPMLIEFSLSWTM